MSAADRNRNWGVVPGVNAYTLAITTPAGTKTLYCPVGAVHDGYGYLNGAALGPVGPIDLPFLRPVSVTLNAVVTQGQLSYRKLTVSWSSGIDRIPLGTLTTDGTTDWYLDPNSQLVIHGGGPAGSASAAAGGPGLFPFKVADISSLTLTPV